MKLYELSMALDEGPRQDRAVELFTQNLPLRQSEGDKVFRHKFIASMMDEFGVTLATAANLYNYARSKAALPDLGRTAARAARGLPPVVRAPRARDPMMPGEAPPVDMPGEAPARNNSAASNAEQLMKDVAKYDGLVDDDDIEWEVYKDEGVVELSWGLQYSGTTAVDAMNEYSSEISAANHTLEKAAHKYKDRVGRLKLQTIEKAQKSDELKGGRPSKDIQYLGGSVDFKL